MRITHFLSVVSIASLTACSTTSQSDIRHLPKDDPETVLVTYHVKPGKENEFRETVLGVWDIYRKEHLVFAQPHVVVWDKEDGGKTRFVETFTWVNHAAPEHVSDAVKKIWDQMQSLCEERNGHGGLEGGEVELLIPERPASKR